MRWRNAFFIASAAPPLAGAAFAFFLANVKVEGWGGLGLGALVAFVLPLLLFLSTTLGVIGLAMVYKARCDAAPTRSLWAATVLASSVVIVFLAMAAWREWGPRPDPYEPEFSREPNPNPRVPRAPIR